jgi:undecaprenyl-diphosphatase
MQFLEAIDQGSLPWFQSHWRDQERLNRFMIGITDAGETLYLTAVTLLGVGLFLVWRRVPTAILFVATALAAGVLDRGFKYLVDRPRPEVAFPLIPAPTLPSFPSGHALISTAVYVSLALLMAARLRRRWLGYLLVAAALLLAFVVGISRLYLCVHYVTDVLAGWAAGLALALTCRLVDDRIPSPTQA